jgi:hypothetical protein
MRPIEPELVRIVDCTTVSLSCLVKRQNNWPAGFACACGAAGCCVSY